MKFYFITVVSLALFAAGCGGSSSSTANINGLGDLPSTASIAASGTSASSYSKAAVDGTPPTLPEISENQATLEALFWGDGFFASFDDLTPPLDETQRRSFYEGEGSCRVYQENARAFRDLAQNTNSLCYMRQIPKAKEGVTITSGSIADTSKVFDQATSTKILKGVVKNMEHEGEDDEGGGPQDIFFRVYGTSSVTSTVYKIDLWFCKEGETSPREYESIEVNKSTGAITHKSVHGGDHGNFRADIEAFIKKSSSGFVFDTDKDRKATMHGTFTDTRDSQTFSGSFKSQISISGSDMENKSRGTFSDGSHTNTHKAYTKGSFSGTKISDVKFPEAGFKFRGNDGDESHNFEHTGAIEFRQSQSPKFQQVSSGTYYDAANAQDLTAGFYEGSLESPDVTIPSDMDCAASPELVFEMDFSAQALKDIQAECETGFDNSGRFCDDVEAVREAREKTFAP